MSSLTWPQAPPTLGDGVVTLRAWTTSDIEAIVEACQDPVLQNSIAVPVPYLAQHAREFVEDFSPQQWASGEGAPFAAVGSRSGRLLAAPSLKGVDPNRACAEVGYWVAPWARGQKIAQRALRLMCGWAFSQVGLRRLEFLIEPTNAASCAVAERMGATREEFLPGKMFIRGSSRDIVRYALET